ncbi:hypothetical protein C2R22_19480 [Salinigranum rubrum]|uniref:Uncharacterized protein n=1 Tax=Salinigranum rubrum TaxID=755307 RepID=A0A2I8VNU9_9EURY|nr:hypothetical protein C2R22_19480 [Salinigranum rubrum]
MRHTGAVSRTLVPPQSGVSVRDWRERTESLADSSAGGSRAEALAAHRMRLRHFEPSFGSLTKISCVRSFVSLTRSHAPTTTAVRWRVLARLRVAPASREG